ncbi:MAG: riboflavin synthase [Methylococcales symbiont of Hymedesmia sp. n. MRB-2018]|nr:MAG: riboflavin synthase [Methylococcales symbiont of Hymedesmia sp. n. MRB-2018]KAF3982921.1 MAG: riboflavin synthase [Methylococcales symbiont of Hymedesmia sp. n. MRB-2018]
MFTGIILAKGQIVAIKAQGGDYQYKIDTGKLTISEAALGDSIAVNGVCLTAVELGSHYFCADVSNETIGRTDLKSASVGSSVNLELALTPTTRLGGHIVSGHVDGLGIVVGKKQDGRSFYFQFKAPDNLAKYIAEKGSICVNGVSLTVNEVDGALFSVNIVPHTLEETTLGDMVVGTKVNLEVDLLARYMERLMQGDRVAMSEGNVTEELLQNSGFMTQ